jgi:hypothetical protein
VIFYVREPRGWLTSLVQQRLKEGMPVAEALATYRRLPYRAWIGSLGDAFGEENVRLRLYQRSRDTSHGVLADLFEAIDERASLAGHFPVEWANSSMPAEAASVLDAVSRIARAEEFDRQYGWLFEQFLLPNLGGAPFRLAPSILDAVVEENADQLAWLSDRLGADILASEEPERQADASPPAPIGEPMARLLFALAAEILKCRSQAMYQQGLRLLVRQDDDGAMRAFARRWRPCRTWSARRPHWSACARTAGPRRATRRHPPRPERRRGERAGRPQAAERVAPLRVAPETRDPGGNRRPTSPSAGRADRAAQRSPEGRRGSAGRAAGSDGGPPRRR